MTAPPARTELADTYPAPSNATFRTGIGKLWDFITSGHSTTIASAAAPDIFAATNGKLIDYTGTATCTGFVAAPSAGGECTLVCAAAAVFTAGANMLIDGVASGSNFTAMAGDKVIVRAVSTTQFRLTPQKYNGMAVAAGNEQALTNFYSCANKSGFQDLYRSGEMPMGFNQQWGGAQWGMLPDGSFGSVATGNIQDDTTKVLGDAAARTHVASGFVQSETFSPPGVWVKAYKVGNPTDNLTWTVRANSSGSPTGAAIFTALTLSGKQITSKTDGELYYISGITSSLTANTTYHSCFSRSGAVDASNYYVIKATASNKYPGGYFNVGDATPTWTPTTAAALCFLIQNPAANSLIQSGGQFDYKLAFNPGTPWNQSRATVNALSNFYDGVSGSVLYRGTFAINTTVFDYVYGLDHSRICMTINGSGYPVLSLYRADTTPYQVTGTVAVTSGFHDVGARWRTVGDGSDYLTGYQDGPTFGTPLTAQTFTMDAEFHKLGNRTLGAGFGLAPAWTQDMQMTSLPSAQGWTWTGTGTEANCVSIQLNKLYQNANGYASTDTGYNLKTIVGVNGTGTEVEVKLQVNTDTNAINVPSCFLRLSDGTISVTVRFHEYFIEIVSNVTTTTAADFIVQFDCKSSSHVYGLSLKGSDYYLKADGKLIVDGTGKAVGSSGAANNISFGDLSATAGANTDAIWSYVKYYQGGMILPIATTGTCSEFAHWSGDKSALFPSLWNSGIPVSVKQLCGVPRNYQHEAVVQREVRTGVTSSPTTSSATPVLLTDMELYSIGDQIEYASNYWAANSAAGYGSRVYAYIDGMQDYSNGAGNGAATAYSTSLTKSTPKPLGLHKVEIRHDTYGSGTVTCNGINRQLTLEARS